MTVATDPLYHDLSGLARLRAAAAQPGERAQALTRVASEFEALFLQMILKHMRAARLGEDPFGGDTTEHYRDWFDAQLALSLARRAPGLGIGRLLLEQLSRGQKPQEAETTGRVRDATAQTAARDGPGRSSRPSPEAFLRQLAPHAERAARTLGVAPEVLLAQAALESGWGRAEIRHPDGRSSHNVFGIKAGADWPGARVRVSTLEYEDGVAVRRLEDFRAYRSYGEAFEDYVRLLRSHPRYAPALAAAGDPERFAAALQRAGYATDPAYADKLRAVLRSETLARVRLALKAHAEVSLT